MVQGSFEVPRKLALAMSGNVVNHLLLTRYENLLNELYIETKNEEIVGTFLSEENEERKQAGAKSWRQKKQLEKKEVRSRVIRDIKPKIKKG